MRLTTRIGLVLVLVISFTNATAQGLDPNMHYLIKANAVAPWELSLNFGNTLFENGSASTVKASLAGEPATKEVENDSILLTWKKRSVENQWGGQDEGASTLNIMNKQGAIDLSSVKDQAALVFDIRVLKVPSERVELRMESNWSAKQRGSVPLKSVFKRLKKKQWITVPIPLQCFDNGDLDFSKITTIFMLHTEGKMRLELGDVRLSAFPQDKVKCAGD